MMIIKRKAYILLLLYSNYWWVYSMDLRKQLEICYLNYKKWKEKAIQNANLDGRKALERAFFWLEIHAALYAIGVLETKVKTKEEKKELMGAKRKIIEKLEEYERTLADELDL